MADQKRGFFSRLFNRRMKEDQVPFKVVSPPHNNLLPNKEDSIVNKIDSAEGIGYSELNNFTSLSERRDMRYSVYDQMRLNDSLASAVLEMYADDITQPDPQGRAIWVESEDTNISEAGNRLLRILKIEEDLWATAYSLVCYGDVYYELFREPRKASLFNEANIKVHSTSKNYGLEDYVERVDDPSEIFDLVYHGQTVGYARTHVNEDKTDSDRWNSIYNSWKYKFRKNDIDLYDSQKFIHFYVPDAGVRHPYKFVLDNTELDGSLKEYVINTGKSLLQDAYKVSQQLQLMETSVLLSRITRASIYRLIQVQVGQKSEADVVSLLNRIKSLIDKKQTFNASSGSFDNYANPGPEVTNIVIPVKSDGQGSINASTIGGDYDPKSLADLDYLVNKELAAFKVPRQFLNFTDGGGFNGGSSLAKISAQYAHRIVRYKRAVIAGVSDLLNIYFDNRYPDYVGKFEVKMTPITTVEDSERVEMARNKLDMVGQIMDQLDKMQDTIGKFKILKDAFEDAYPNSVVSKVLGDYIEKLESSQKNPPVYGDGDNSLEGDDMGGSSGSSFSSGGSDLGGDFDDLGGEDTDSFASDDGGDVGDGGEFPTDLSGEGVDLTDTNAVDDLVGDEE